VSQANNDDVSLTSKTLARLEPYSWAGNIHELENLMEQIALLSGKPLLDADDVEAYLPQRGRTNCLTVFRIDERSCNSPKGGHGDVGTMLSELLRQGPRVRMQSLARTKRKC